MVAVTDRASQTWHEPLFLKCAGAERLRRTIALDDFARQAAEGVLQRVQQIAAEPLPAIVHEPGRLVMLPTARALFDRVINLGVAAMLTGSNALRRRGIAELVNAASFTDWNPAHFLDTAEMAAAVAIGLDWFSPGMSADERTAVEDALVSKALEPGLEQLNIGSFWVTATHNWNVVCCGGLIVAAVALRAHRPAIAQAVLERAVPAIGSGLSAYDAQGGYPEGPGYWEYATKYAVLALAALDDAGLAYPLPVGLSHTWRYNRETTAPSGACFDYGDTLERPGRSPVLGWLARSSGEADAAIWQREAPGDPHPLDLVWLSNAPTAVTQATSTAVAFPDAGISILRRDGDGLYAGLKGGRNDGNHAHLDLGSFVLEWRARRLFGEIGRDDYALPGYFDPDTRFNYFRLGTAGHSTLVIDGQNQSTSARAICLGTSERPDFLATAWRIEDEASPVSHCRGIAVAGDCIWIVDELTASGDGDVDIGIEWRGYTRAAVTASGSTVSLSLGGEARTVHIVEPAGLAWRAGAAPSPHGQGSNDGFTLLRFGVRMRGSSMRFSVAAGRVLDMPAPPPIAQWQLQSPGPDCGARPGRAGGA